MALLIDIGLSGWITAEEIAQTLRRHNPQADLRVASAPGDLSQITMLAVSNLDPDLPAKLPNLQLVQKLGAGVETIVHHPALPDHIRVARLKPEAPAREISQWFLAHILDAQLNLGEYRKDQQLAQWSPRAPREPHDTVIGILGLGHIGGYTARLMSQMGFQTRGWSRSPKSLSTDIALFHGRDALPGMLSACDHVCAILPSTGETRGLFDADLLAAMKPGSQLLNAGRGDLIDEAALLAALDTNRPGRAVLDVVSQEPLPPDNPLWRHPGVTITPHVSGWHLGDALHDVADNFRRLQNQEPLLHEVDRARGY